jgi:hypothetical protein
MWVMLGPIVYLINIGHSAQYFAVLSQGHVVLLDHRWCPCCRGMHAKHFRQPSGKSLAFVSEAVKNALVISQVNRALWEINPTASRL